MSPKKRIIINDDIRKRGSNSIIRSKFIIKQYQFVVYSNIILEQSDIGIQLAS